MVFNKLPMMMVLIAAGITGCGRPEAPPAAIAATPLSPVVAAPKPAVFEEDDESLKKMTEEMQKDRQQQRRIKALKMEKEQTDLELEEQKALAELNKFRRNTTDPVNEGAPPNSPDTDIKVAYIGGANLHKEAIVSINGTNYAVKEKERPLKDMEVVAITDNDVTIHFLSPQDTTATYPFKSE
jgi:hypothetical protein